MKHFVLLFSLLLAGSLVAQPIRSVSFAPTAPKDCDNLVVTTDGDLPCANTAFQGSSHSINAGVITVSLDHITGGICLPAIFPYTQGHTVGMVPPGTYTLIVEFINDGMVVATSSQSITIGSCCPVNAGFVASGTSICRGDSLTFSASDGSETAYNWKVDGVSVSQDTSYTHVFNTAGTSTIELEVGDGSCTNTTSQPITIDAPINIKFNQVVDESCPGAMDGRIDLLISGGNNPFTYQWASGQNTEDINGLVGGQYIITVTSAGGCVETDSTLVQTGMAPIAGFSGSDTLACVDNSLSFGNQSQGMGTIQWLLDGSLLGQDSMVNITATMERTALLELVIGSGICADTASQRIRFSEPAELTVIAQDEVCPDAANGNIDLQFKAGVRPFTYLWSNGDTTEDLSNLAPGTYSVTITDQAGCILVDTQTIGSVGGIMAQFMFANRFGSLSVDFTDDSSPIPTSWLWDFGDGQIDSSQNPMYTYADRGIYDVCLIATDSFGCVDTTCQEIIISLNSIDLATRFGLKLAPVPAQSQLTVDMGSAFSAYVSIRLVNALGNSVLETSLPYQPQYTLEVQDLSPGIYHCEITWDRYRAVMPFIKQ